MSEYKKELQRLQNAKRSKHGAPPLTMSETLNAVAQEWADHLAKTGVFQHRPRSQYGENIFMGYNSAGPIPGEHDHICPYTVLMEGRKSSLSF